MEVAGRGALEPICQSVTLRRAKASVEQPDDRRFHKQGVVRADMTQRRHKQRIDSQGADEVLSKQLNLQSSDTLSGWSEKPARKLRPANPLMVPEFMSPQVMATSAPAQAPPTAESSSPSAKALAYTNHPLCKKLAHVIIKDRIRTEHEMLFLNQQREVTAQFHDLLSEDYANKYPLAGSGELIDSVDHVPPCQHRPLAIQT